MKVVYRGIVAAQGVVYVVVAAGGYETRIQLPFGFTGSREDIEAIVRQQMGAVNAVADPIRAVLPLEGSNWDIPDAKTKRSHKKMAASKGAVKEEK